MPRYRIAGAVSDFSAGLRKGVLVALRMLLGIAIVLAAGVVASVLIGTLGVVLLTVLAGGAVCLVVAIVVGAFR